MLKLKILLAILIVVIGLPTITLGSSFTISLIQGKTPSEAVQILAEQIDSILGRVESLESQQVQTNEDVNATQLEIERLRLENANLKLKSEENKDAIGLVDKCKTLERPLVCLRYVVKINQDILAKPEAPISLSTSIQDVFDIAGYKSPLYIKTSTDEICTQLKGMERCSSRTTIINNLNNDQARERSSASSTIQSELPTLQKMESEFEFLSCPTILEKYLPNREKPVGELCA